ncbi:MAG: nucleoside monophosphate kinase, partial [Candidatus Latescibacteria bacterium]|nr:nucleoside monophosphate kinase [Candidatus Latescibacterota bacterium]
MKPKTSRWETRTDSLLQAKLVKKYFGIVHLSTGDILRAEIAQATPLGIKAKSYIDKGHLVPDN